MYGYHGRILTVDLTSNTVRTEEISEELARKFIGGSGLAAHYLMEMTTPDTAPFDPENPLIFMTGPFCGTKIPLSGRHAVVARSPLSGAWGESEVGGHWGEAFKATGYDGLIVTGRANCPVYLWIHEDGVEIRDASHLWGRDTVSTEDSVRQATHPQAQVSSIGPAGERLVRFAAIISNGKDGRAAGRTGMGAVMGSKNLKAVAAYGKKPTPVKDAEALGAVIKEILQPLAQGTAGMKKYGTSGGAAGHEALGNFPIKNWVQARWPEGVAKINGVVQAETMLTSRFYCGQCIVGCGRVVAVKEGEYAPVEGAGPEYETVGMLGGMCLVDNLEAIAQANQLCNRYGIDTISTGAAIAFAMECWERGLITAADTDGVELTWGNHRAMVEMVRQIGERRALGKLLGEGVKRAAEAMGGEALDFAHHVKGLEPPAHDPRAYHGVALSYATSNRGACHLQGFTHGFERALTMEDLGYPEPHHRHQQEGKALFVKQLQDLMCQFDALKICKFAMIGGLKARHLVDFIRHLTGWDMTLDELMVTGERMYNLKRLYNLRCGLTRHDDRLPKRFLTLPREGEGLEVKFPPLDEMLSEYYEVRGWDSDGVPTAATLIRLGLEAYAENTLKGA